MWITIFHEEPNSYVSITDQKKKNNKEVNLYVISTVEKSKIVSYPVNKLNTFKYEIIGNDFFNGEKIINEIEEKYNQNLKITQKESIYFSLAPIMTKNGNIEKNIKRTVNILITLNDLSPSTKNLCYGIQWLLTDKYIMDKKLRNLLLDLLGDKMSAIYEYVERKEKIAMQKGMQKGMQEGMQKVLIKLYNSGMSINEISEKTDLDIEQVKELLN